MMQHTRFRIVAGTVADARQWPCREDVRLEAQRRLNVAGYTRYRARSLATGVEIPETIRNYALQINFVSDKLTALKPIPHDFQSDIYWPVLDNEH